MVEFDDASHAGGYTHYSSRFVKRKVRSWQRRKARPIRVSDPNSYIPREAAALPQLVDRLKASGKPVVEF